MKDLDKLKELASTLPEGVKANAEALLDKMGEVIEGIGDRPIEYRPSFMKVIQATSDRSKLPKGTGIGDVVIGEDNMGNTLKVIPFRAFTIRQMWSPDQNEARILCHSPDDKMGSVHGNCRDCNYGKFDPERNKSDCNRVVNVIGITEDLSKVFTTTFAKTNYSNGKDWTELMRKAGVSPYKRVYQLHTETSKKSKNVEALLASNGEAVDKEFLPFLEELFNRVGKDREEHLAAFYEYLHRKANAANAVALEAPASTVMLTDNSETAPAVEGTSETIVVDEPAETRKTGSKKYSV